MMKERWRLRSTSGFKVEALAACAFALRFVALSAFFPFLFTYLDECGVDAPSRGALAAATGAVRSVAPALAGYLADRTGRHALVFAIALGLNSAAIYGLTLEPHTLSRLALALTLASIFDGSSLLDALVMRSMAWAGRAERAPAARAFGSLSWCIASPLMGIGADRYGYEALFRAYCAVQLITLPVVLALPLTEAFGSCATAALGDNSGASDMQLSPLRRMWRIVRDRLVDLVLIAFVGLHMGIAASFCAVYMLDELGGSNFWVGFSLTLQAAIEVPLFRLSTRILGALGHRSALLSCSLAAAIRLGGYALASAPVAVLPGELGHGWSFAIAYSTIAAMSGEYAAIGLQATAVGILNGVLQFGQLSAIGIGGVVADAVGMRYMFRVTACGFAVIALPLLFSAPECSTYLVRRLLHTCRRGGRFERVRATELVLESFDDATAVA